MTEAEARHRAAEAQRLLDEPLLKEALAWIEQSTFDELIACRGAEPEDDRRRRMLVDRFNVIREIRTDLARAIAQGKAAAEPKKWA